MPDGSEHPNPARKAWMEVLAKADAAALAKAVVGLGPEPGFAWLRPPEIGTVMVRGRQGGTGAPFNLGEMSVTRCTLRLEDGTVGHAYVPGRDQAHARRAAICDALMQGGSADRVRDAVISPLAQAADAARAAHSAKAQATKVDFFTLVRGEA